MSTVTLGLICLHFADKYMKEERDIQDYFKEYVKTTPISKVKQELLFNFFLEVQDLLTEWELEFYSSSIHTPYLLGQTLSLSSKQKEKVADIYYRLQDQFPASARYELLCDL